MQENFKRDIPTKQTSVNAILRPSVQCQKSNAPNSFSTNNAGILTTVKLFAKTPSLLAISAIKIYQKFISPMFPPACRFFPTCSQYSADAIAQYGIIKGIYLGIRRLLRCHPFHPGGYDPVK